MYAKIVLVFLFILECKAAVTHLHSSALNKEREEDGAYSPRTRSSSSEGKQEFDHEAILGSARDAEEYDHLSPEESKRRLRILLTKMDLNRDMLISKHELTQWILKSFKSLSEEEAKEGLEDVDENADGKASWDEYVTNTYDSEDSEMELDNEELKDADRAMWLVADQNRDDLLEGDEWVAFSHPEEHQRMFQVILSQTLKQKDLDNDESISFQEYIGDNAKSNNMEWLHAEKDKFDNEFDQNKDGKLTGNEIIAWVVPSNQEIAEEEVNHLFASSDDNHDDKLSFDEVVDHHEIFVGSEVTDYGDHLHKLSHFDDEL